MSHNNLSLPITPPLFQGREEMAMYNKDLPIDFYRGNPLIEALPEILSDDETIDRLTNIIEITEEQRKLPVEHRDHYLESISHFFKPLSKHLMLQRQFSRMIRFGYMGRNPVEQRFWLDLQDRAKQIQSNQLEGKLSNLGASGSALVGISGMGKSRAVREILYRFYPQVIYHSEYNNRKMPFQQVVWLILECPHNASIKSLIHQFFWAFDTIFEQNYLKGYAGRGRASADDMLIPMATVAMSHGLGLLVVDEIQNISLLSSGGDQKMLNLFVKLVNLIGVPILLIGTPQAMNSLTTQFRMARRLSGQGDPKWDRMQYQDRDWKYFAETLWKHQYLRQPTPLTPELSYALHQASMGITDIAVKTFIFAQRRAMDEAVEDGDERLTPELIASIPPEELSLADSVLAALRQLKEHEISRVKDVYVDHRTPTESIKPSLNKVQENATTSEKSNSSNITNQLLSVVSNKPSENSAYEALLRSGHIKPLSDLFNL